MKKKNDIPIFKNEDEEREFWATHSILDFPGSFKRIKMDFSALKASTKPITIRLPESMIYSLKMMSNKRDVPYQSFIKTILHDKIREEYAK
jgi:predicted DNA binding CopG/RHH family protein